QGRFLVDHLHALEIQKPVGVWMAHQAGHFEMPEASVHPRIDYVLGHAIKLIVRGNRLDVRTFVLRAVVAESRDAKKLARDGGASASKKKTEHPQQKSAPAQVRRKFGRCRR